MATVNGGRKPGSTNYTTNELVSLMGVIKSILPVTPGQWNAVVQTHANLFPASDRDVRSVRRKYMTLYSKKIPIGDPSCPEAVRMAKEIKYLIGQKEKVESLGEEFDTEEGCNNSEDNDNNNNNNNNISPPLGLQKQPPFAASVSTTAASASTPRKRPYKSIVTGTGQEEEEDSDTRKKRSDGVGVGVGVGIGDLLSFLEKNAEREREERKEFMDCVKSTICDVAKILANRVAPNKKRRRHEKEDSDTRKRDDVIDIDEGDEDSVVSTLSFDQKPIRKRTGDTPRTALVNGVRDAVINRLFTQIHNVDTGLPSSPDLVLGRDVAHFFDLPMETMKHLAGCVLEAKKDAEPEDLERLIDQVYPFPSSQIKAKSKSKEGED